MSGVVLLTLLPVILVLVLMIPILIISQQKAKRRQALAAGWAASHGCVFVQSNPAMTARVSRLPFSNSSNPQIAEFIEGKTPGGRGFCSFLYSYVVSNGKTTETVQYSVQMVHLPVALPWMSVTRERLGDKIAKFFGGQDIELESDDFNRMFRVTSANDALAYGVLHPQVMQWLMGPALGLVPFMIDLDDLVCWRPGVPDYATLDAQLLGMDSFVDHIPQGVYEQFALPPAPPVRGVTWRRR